VEPRPTLSEAVTCGISDLLREAPVRSVQYLPQTSPQDRRPQRWGRLCRVPYATLDRRIARRGISLTAPPLFIEAPGGVRTAIGGGARSGPRPASGFGRETRATRRPSERAAPVTDLRPNNNTAAVTFGSGPHRPRSAILVSWCSATCRTRSSTRSTTPSPITTPD
jgi:hypothetical protein